MFLYGSRSIPVRFTELEFSFAYIYGRSGEDVRLRDCAALTGGGSVLQPRDMGKGISRNVKTGGPWAKKIATAKLGCSIVPQ